LGHTRVLEYPGKSANSNIRRVVLGNSTRVPVIVANTDKNKYSDENAVRQEFETYISFVNKAAHPLTGLNKHLLSYNSCNRGFCQV
jgi:hypothetical protein